MLITELSKKTQIRSVLCGTNDCTVTNILDLTMKPGRLTGGQLEAIFGG